MEIATEKRPESFRGTRLKILIAAIKRFRKNGFHSTSLEEIAKSARATRTTIYYYFKDKEELLHFIQITAANKLLHIARSVRARTLSPDSELRRTVETTRLRNSWCLELDVQMVQSRESIRRKTDWQALCRNSGEVPDEESVKVPTTTRKSNSRIAKRN